METIKDMQFSNEEIEILEGKRIAVIGCGGLGGYVLEMLARFGIGEIVIVDYEVFNTKNISRQVMSSQASLGKYKVSEAVLWIKQVNPFIYVKGMIERLNKDNAGKILKGCDMVMDCVDNVETKFILQDVCAQLNIPLIHGAVEGWTGQVSTILPHDKTLDKIYEDEDKNKELERSSFIPAAVASYQVTECIKVLLDKGEILRNRVLHIDLLNNKNTLTDFY